MANSSYACFQQIQQWKCYKRCKIAHGWDMRREETTNNPKELAIDINQKQDKVVTYRLISLSQLPFWIAQKTNIKNILFVEFECLT